MARFLSSYASEVTPRRCQRLMSAPAPLAHQFLARNPVVMRRCGTLDARHLAAQVLPHHGRAPCVAQVLSRRRTCPSTSACATCWCVSTWRCKRWPMRACRRPHSVPAGGLRHLDCQYRPPLQPTAATLFECPQARALATQVWEAAASDTRVSDGFRAITAENLSHIEAIWPASLGLD